MQTGHSAGRLISLPTYHLGHSVTFYTKVKIGLYVILSV